MSQGVTSLSWTRSGFNLLAVGPYGPVNDEDEWQAKPNDFMPLPSQSTAEDQRSWQNQKSCAGHLVSFRFVHGGLPTNATCYGPSSLILLGEDRLLSWRGRPPRGTAALGEEDDDASHSVVDSTFSAAGHFDSDHDWDLVQVPSNYVNSNWPLRWCSVSISGAMMAVAGEHGLALFNKLANKWRLFGNLNHELHIKCQGLWWYGEHVIVVANQVEADGSNSHPADTIGKDSLLHPRNDDPSPVDTACTELLFFPRSHLDNSSLLHSHLLRYRGNFLGLAIEKDTMVVHLDSGQMLVYGISCLVEDSQSSRPPVSSSSSYSFSFFSSSSSSQPQAPLRRYVTSPSTSSHTVSVASLNLSLFYSVQTSYLSEPLQLGLWTNIPSPFRSDSCAHRPVEDSGWESQSEPFAQEVPVDPPHFPLASHLQYQGRPPPSRLGILVLSHEGQLDLVEVLDRKRLRLNRLCMKRDQQRDALRGATSTKPHGRNKSNLLQAFTRTLDKGVERIWLAPSVLKSAQRRSNDSHWWKRSKEGLSRSPTCPVDVVNTLQPGGMCFTPPVEPLPETRYLNLYSDLFDQLLSSPVVMHKTIVLDCQIFMPMSLIIFFHYHMNSVCPRHNASRGSRLFTYGQNGLEVWFGRCPSSAISKTRQNTNGTSTSRSISRGASTIASETNLIPAKGTQNLSRADNDANVRDDEACSETCPTLRETLLSRIR